MIKFNFVDYFMIPQRVCQQLEFIDLWKARLTAYGLSDETIKTLWDNINAGAVQQLTWSNWGFCQNCMQRVQYMAERGDSPEQIIDWTENLPLELFQTMFANSLMSAFGESIGVGGPGALFKPK